MARLAHADDDQLAVAPVVALAPDDGVDGTVETLARDAVRRVELRDAGECRGGGVEEVHGAGEARLDGELLFTCCDGGLDEVVQGQLVDGRAKEVVFGGGNGRWWGGVAAVVVEVVREWRLAEDVDLAVVDGPMFNHGCGCGCGCGCGRRLGLTVTVVRCVLFAVPTFGCGWVGGPARCRYLAGLGSRDDRQADGMRRSTLEGGVTARMSKVPS